MAKAFSQNDIRDIVRRAERMVSAVEKDFSRYDQKDWDKFQAAIAKYTAKSTKVLFENFYDAELKPRGVKKNEIPAIFTALRDKSISDWETTLQRAFATVADSATEARQSIFTRVGKQILRLRKYLREVKGKPLTDIRNVPGISVRSKHRDDGTTDYYAYIKGKPAASLKAGHTYIRDVRVSPEFQGIGLGVLLIKHVAKLHHVSAVAEPVVDKPLNEEELINFYSKMGFMVVGTEGGRPRMIYKARMPEYDDEELLAAPKKLFGFIRARADFKGRWAVGFVNYLRLLFRTIPYNLERELMSWVIRIYADRELFWIRGGIIPTSCPVCRWCDNKVLDKDALDFVTKSPVLSVHLFHPHCLTPDNLVLTAEGALPIREVRPGAVSVLMPGITEPIRSHIEREYVGRVTTFRHGDAEVTTTPDHFHLTNVGWAAAKDVRVGNYFCGNILGKGPVGGHGSVPNSKNGVAECCEKLIPPVVSLFARAITVAASVNFDVEHVVKNKIKNPAIYRNLGNSLREGSEKHGFVLVKVSLERLRLGFGDLLADSRFAGVSFGIYEMLLSRATRNTEFAHQFCNGSRTPVSDHRGDFFARETFFVVDPQQKLLDLFLIFFSQWSLCEEVTHNDYSGKVYDLEVENTGMFSINGSSIVHNCRHSVNPVTADFKGKVLNLKSALSAFKRGILGRSKR